MIRMTIQLMKTSRVIRELLALGIFRELRITRDGRGLNTELIVQHHGVTSVMGRVAAAGLCEAIRRERSTRALQAARR